MSSHESAVVDPFCFRLYYNLKRSRQGAGGGSRAGGIRYRHAPADEQPLTWNAPSDDQGMCRPVLLMCRGMSCVVV